MRKYYDLCISTCLYSSFCPHSQSGFTDRGRINCFHQPAVFNNQFLYLKKEGLKNEILFDVGHDYRSECILHLDSGIRILYRFISEEGFEKGRANQ